MFKKFLIKLQWLLTAQFGLDPIRFWRSLRGFPRFVINWMIFHKGFTGSIYFMPCLHDRFEEGGGTKNEYFWQDLIVARWIHEASPTKHVDVGSRVDGFVAHVASFREIEVFDVRPISTKVPGVTFSLADLMDSNSIATHIAGGGYCDSLSCLHALEHFGLGRYGDPVDPNGYRRGMANLAKLLKSEGRLYLSTPIGHERVEFDANWVFSPQTIINLATDCGLRLDRLHVFQPDAGLVEILPERWGGDLKYFATKHYQLAVMQFIKTDTPTA